MRTTPLLLSLAATAAARPSSGGGGLRPARKEAARRSSAAAPARPHTAEEAARAERRQLANRVHGDLRQKEEKTAPREGSHSGRRSLADRGGKPDAGAPAGAEDGERELKKAKAYGYKSAKGYGQPYQPYFPSSNGNSNGNGNGSGNNGTEPDRWDSRYTRYSGKSAKGYAESAMYYSGKSGKGWSGSGKSGKAEGGAEAGGHARRCDRGYAYVTVTNISYLQSLSDIFFMTALYEVTDVNPIYTLGKRANNALADMALKADPTEVLRRYTDRRGVEQAKIYSDFTSGDNQEKYLGGGRSATFTIDTTGHGDRLSLAAGMPFTNDGFVALEGVPIVDGATYRLHPLDAGVEGNIQTCWSVPALEADFPPQAECSDDDLSDNNNNDIPGENFVSMHRGMQVIDEKGDLERLLNFPECEALDLDSKDDASDKTRFAQYFYEIGYNDESLLCGRTVALPGCAYADDADFLAFLDKSTEYDGEDDRAVALALKSENFGDFCDEIEEANKDIEDALKTLEPVLFDWRNDVAHVEIDCGYWEDEDGKEDPVAREDDDYTGRFQTP